MKTSTLLINEPPLQVLPSLAKAIGLNEAIVTQQLHYWLTNKNCAGFTDPSGEKWIFNTYEEWQENFPFWSTSTIKRTFLELEEKKVVISHQFDAKSRDMRKYYRLNYEQLCTLQGVNLTSSTGSHRDDVKGNTETTTENDTEEKKPSSKPEIDKVAEWLKMSQFPGAKKALRVDSILSYCGVALRRTTTSREWEDFAKWVDERQQKHGESVEAFVKWLLSQKNYDPQFWPVKKMQEFWPSAFAVAEVEDRPELKPFVPEEGYFVPRPKGLK